MRIARVPFASRLPHATWAAVGQSNARRQNLPRRASYARLFQDSGVLGRLPVQFEAGADALAAVGLAEIRDRGGNLEWPESFCSALSVLCVTGSLLALAMPAPSVVPVGRMLNLTLLSLPNTCGAKGVEAGGKAIRGMSLGPAVGWPRVSVTEYVSCKVTAKRPPNGIDCFNVVPNLPCSFETRTLVRGLSCVQRGSGSCLPYCRSY